MAHGLELSCGYLVKDLMYVWYVWYGKYGIKALKEKLDNLKAKDWSLYIICQHYKIVILLHYKIITESESSVDQADSEAADDFVQRQQFGI